MRLPLLALTAAGALSFAQSPGLSLGKRNAAITEPFSDIVGLAELNDGRVIVSDRIEKSYSLADFRSGARKAIGRNGTGPNEYGIPFGPIPWRGDTLLGYDPNNRQLLRISQAATIVGAVPFPQPRAGGISRWSPPRGVDSRGRIYWDTPIIEMQPEVKRSAQAQLARWRPGADTAEPVMRIADHGEFEHAFRYRPIPQSDAWVVGSDGRVGVISAAEYRLRWYLDGKVVETGAPIPYTPVKVTNAEREAFRAKKALEPTSGMASTSGDPATRSAATRERMTVSWPDSLFPAVLPPFEAGGALLAPNGDIWVKRTVPAEETSARVDILDAHGKLRGSVVLPPKAKLLALGASSVYLIATDDDGLQTIERYGYPPSVR